MTFIRCTRCNGRGGVCAGCLRSGVVRPMGAGPSGKSKSCVRCGGRKRVPCLPEQGHVDDTCECDVCGARARYLPHPVTPLRGIGLHACPACMLAWENNQRVALDAFLTERQGLRGPAEFVAEPSPVVELSTDGYSTWLGRSAMDSRRLHAVFIARMTPFGPVGFVEWRNPAELSAHEFVRWATFGGDG